MGREPERQAGGVGVTDTREPVNSAREFYRIMTTILDGDDPWPGSDLSYADLRRLLEMAAGMVVGVLEVYGESLGMDLGEMMSYLGVSIMDYSVHRRAS
jgi:hypothetical protein